MSGADRICINYTEKPVFWDIPEHPASFVENMHKGLQDQ